MDEQQKEILKFHGLNYKEIEEFNNLVESLGLVISKTYSECFIILEKSLRVLVHSSVIAKNELESLFKNFKQIEKNSTFSKVKNPYSRKYRNKLPKFKRRVI